MFLRKLTVDVLFLFLNYINSYHKIISSQFASEREGAGVSRIMALFWFENVRMVLGGRAGESSGDVIFAAVFYFYLRQTLTQIR